MVFAATQLIRLDTHRSMKTTSIHTLNADRCLDSKLKIGLYFLLNMVNNSLPYVRHERNLQLRPFVIDNIDNYWSSLQTNDFPARVLSNLFWMTLPWSKIHNTLGSIHIFDTGCGTGIYGQRLLDWSGQCIDGYYGIDVVAQPEWTKLQAMHDQFHFQQVSSSQIRHIIPQTSNFFISQSAIEHFDEDLGYFEQIRDFIDTHHKTAIQVHIFPSAACLWLYGQHGVRQYTVRAVAKIARLFQDSSYAVLYALRGEHCNRLHYTLLPRPGLRGNRDYDYRKENLAEYENRLRHAIEADMQAARCSVPTFYALCIHSHWNIDENCIF
jgi:hypothetical protein